METALVKAYVDLDAIGENVTRLKNLTGSETLFMAVVKADGYGHGAVAVAKKVLTKGASWLGVARFHEAVEIRKAGIIAPILVFSYVEPEWVARAVDLNLILSVYNLEMAELLSQAAVAIQKKVRVHLKVDTGMGRVGMIVNRFARDPQLISDIEKMKELPGIEIHGLYTHFAAADETDEAHTLEQIDKFEAVLARLKQKNIQIPICHAANSAGIIRFKEAHFDMVRAGISLYGLYPSAEVDPSLVRLKPAMRLTAVVTAVRTVPEFFNVSYGMTWQTQKPTRLASVSIGYADGFSRLLSSNGVMLVKGQRAPIVGRVCMDQTMIDVGHIPGVKAGDEVVLIGTQGSETITADEIAGYIGTINYEVVSALTSRVGKVYSGSL